ncbi:MULTISPECIES: oligosaccharide flippase family protein [Geobacter]|uniref:oligosaccharide flippase family protein n=1 Tax=Geobacter TaxID=28231 RepID=UPI00257275A5|nr:oligosaccharide flippase family protein [Geobacter sulfurreducens]BEH09162.1 oligosaccharide flippase family protein [Geobacter sulfurreducens subsp. ethanolicus]BET57045.1 oligosaccharide flippase family protein [Geobacter sp. 60473]
MMDGKLTFRAVAEAVALLLGAASMIYMSRVVGPEYVGFSAATSAVLLLLARFADGGLTALSSQRLARDDDTLGSLLALTVPPKIVLSCAVIAATLLVARFAGIDPRLAYFLSTAVFLIFFEVFSPAWVFVALGEINTASFIRVAQSSIYALVVFAFIRAPLDWQKLPYIMVLNSALGCVLALLFLGRRRVLSLDRRQFGPAYGRKIRQAFAESRHFLKADLSLYVFTTSDRLILYYFATPHAVGIYEAAYKIINPFYAISSIVTPTMFRPLAQSFKQGTPAAVLSRFTFLMLVGTVPLGFFLLLFSDSIIMTLYGPSFSESIACLQVLGFAISLGYAAGAIVLPFSAWNMAREYGATMIYGNIFNVLLNVALIPSLGGVGAALSTVAAKLAVALAAYRHFRNVTDYPILSDLLLFAVMACAPLLLVLALGLAVENPVILMAVYAASYAALVLVLVRTRYSRLWKDAV